MSYEPAEDSYLLQKHIKKYAIGRVLDLGTGSGIQALTAVKGPNVREVIAADIDEEVIRELKIKTIRKIKAIQSDLFENIQGQFNLIIFNPPYLPQDKGIEDLALYGGKKGWETSKRFLDEVSGYLLPDGVILFLFSTLTRKGKIDEIIQDNLLEYEQIDSQKLAFEELFVYKIIKSPLLRELESKGIENIHYFNKGKRGIIYKGILDKSKLIKSHFPSKRNILDIAIKTKNKESEAQNRIENEVKWLKILNKSGIGPRLVLYENNFLAYGFVEGEFIMDWIKEHNKSEIKAVLKNVLEQCLILDELKVNKEEMHHPLKHILVKDTPVLIDFERCSQADNPKNVTQFIEFLCRIQKELGKKGIDLDVNQLRELSKEYKDTYDENVLKDILWLFFSQKF